MTISFRTTVFAAMAALLLPISSAHTIAAESGQVLPMPPKVGDEAADFKLAGLDGKPVELAKVAAEGPAVLVLLRGWPGYQCPVCTEQVAGLVRRADDFRAAGARVILVYPGAADELAKHAEEFLKSAKLPAPLMLVTDPDYVVTNAYHLRWNASGETAYPSTFVVDRNRKIVYAKVSKTHGDRADMKDVLAALAALPQK